MVRTCKHEEQNNIEHKCGDYYYGGPRHKCMCRLTEWKKKVGVCPYDPGIHSSVKAKPIKLIKGQQTLMEKRK